MNVSNQQSFVKYWSNYQTPAPTRLLIQAKREVLLNEIKSLKKIKKTSSFREFNNLSVEFFTKYWCYKQSLKKFYDPKQVRELPRIERLRLHAERKQLFTMQKIRLRNN